MANKQTMEQTQTAKTTISNGDRRMLGFDLDWWNSLMLGSLAVAAAAATITAFSTYVVIKLQKAESQDAALKLAATMERAAKAELELAKMQTPRVLDEKHMHSLTNAMSPFKGQRVSVGATPFTVEAEALALQIVGALKAAGVQADFNQAAAEAQIGAANGVVARCTTGNPSGEKFAVTFAAAMNEAGIKATPVGGLIEDIVPALAKQGRPREHPDNSWIVISVGAKF